MVAPVLTVEPSSARAGDTWRWQRVAADFPVSEGWALTWHLSSAGNHYSQAGSGSGDTWTATWSSSTTASIVPGRYTWAAQAVNGSDKVTVATGSIVVGAALTAAADTRSHARKCLDALEAVLENRATSAQQEMQIGDRVLKYLPHAELIRLRSVYSIEVTREEAAARVASGGARRSPLLVRFGR